MRRAVLSDLRDALIAIIDPSVYRLDLERTVVAATGKATSQWPSGFVDWFRDRANEYEVSSIIWDSPIPRIQEFLEDDGDSIGDVGGIPGNVDDRRSIITDLVGTMSLQTIRFIGARTAASFSGLLERPDSNSLAVLSDTRYVMARTLFRLQLPDIGETQHVFDEGNSPSVTEVGKLSEAIADRLDPFGDQGPRRRHSHAVELKSHTVPMLQVADLAGGYARDLYLSGGLRPVCEEFSAVILNGSMVRDWKQVPRTNLTELRGGR